jgi:hypothetical protein
VKVQWQVSSSHMRLAPALVQHSLNSGARKPLARYRAIKGALRSRLASSRQISGGSVPHVAEASIPDVA